MDAGITITKRRPPSRSIDLNSLLQIGNVFVIFLTFWAYCLNGGNQYVDGYTVLISVAFALQNSLLLCWEKKSREPMLLLLMITVVLFYLFRVATLLYEPWSAVLIRFPFAPQDMNHAYLFIMFSVLALSLGIKLGRTARMPEVTLPLTAGVESKVFFLSMLVILLDLLAVFGMVIPLQGFISVLLNADILLVLMLVVYAVGKDSLQIPRHCYGGLLVAFLAIRTLNGSRSALLTAAFSVLFVLFTLQRRVRIRRWVLISLMSILPVAFIGFSITTFYRPFRQAKLIGVIDLTWTEFLTRYLENVTSGSVQDNLKVVLRPMFDRTGYLDMAADTITNRDSYGQMINPVYYLKSVVDNVLTPGFDVFDVPKAANNAVSVYNNLPLLKRSEVDTFYQSDMFTLFGESYVFFGGYAALVACFLVGFFAKVLFESVSFGSGIWPHVYRAVFYKLYVLSLWSFGLDWQVADLFFFLISVAFLYLLLNVRLPRLAGRRLQTG